MADTAMGPKFWADLLTKHGPWALGCVIIGAAFYLFTLKPMAAERTLLLEIVTHQADNNARAITSIESSTSRIADSTELQYAMLDAFSATVPLEHKLQNDKLDQIIRASGTD